MPASVEEGRAASRSAIGGAFSLNPLSRARHPAKRLTTPAVSLLFIGFRECHRPWLSTGLRNESSVGFRQGRDVSFCVTFGKRKREISLCDGSRCLTGTIYRFCCRGDPAGSLMAHEWLDWKVLGRSSVIH